MHDNLAGFVKALENRGLLDFNILGESEEHINNRLKIQKYVYLVKYYGLDMHYDYNMYLLGPCSQQLAWDYYSLAKNPEKYGNAMKATTRDQFFELVRNRNSEWLEVASTLLSLREYFRDRESLLNRTANMKERIPFETVLSVLNELEHLKLITF
ncbi:MAG: hypothetical protein WAK17_10515 [Candidatus Nitrosopolaris sp.]